MLIQSGDLFYQEICHTWSGEWDSFCGHLTWFKYFHFFPWKLESFRKKIVVQTLKNILNCSRFVTFYLLYTYTKCILNLFLFYMVFETFFQIGSKRCSTLSCLDCIGLVRRVPTIGFTLCSIFKAEWTIVFHFELDWMNKNFIIN